MIFEKLSRFDPDEFFILNSRKSICKKPAQCYIYHNVL